MPYNFSEKRKKDFSLYTYERLDGVTVGKIPGEIDGEDFVIENCTVCLIHITALTSNYHTQIHGFVHVHVSTVDVLCQCLADMLVSIIVLIVIWYQYMATQ